jgi:hypothetical protein
MRANEFVTEKKRMKKLKELTFMGMSPCTKDCSGHRAGYQWSKARGGVSTASQSQQLQQRRRNSQGWLLTFGINKIQSVIGIFFVGV